MAEKKELFIIESSKALTTQQVEFIKQQVREVSDRLTNKK